VGGSTEGVEWEGGPSALGVGAATYPATNSGITLAPGCSLVATATGTWSVGGPYGIFDADGTTLASGFESCAPAPTTPMGTLVGSLDGMSWFPIGTGPTTITGEGTLMLSANDCSGPDGAFFSDNFDEVIVTLTLGCP